MNEILIEIGTKVIMTLVLLLFSALFTWLSSKLGKVKELESVNEALAQLADATETTVAMLQQTIVEDLKKKSEDGKLTKEEIADLNQQLLDVTKQQLSESAMQVIESAGMDLNTIIANKGEAFVLALKGE